MSNPLIHKTRTCENAGVEIFYPIHSDYYIAFLSPLNAYSPSVSRDDASQVRCIDMTWPYIPNTHDRLATVVREKA